MTRARKRLVMPEPKIVGYCKTAVFAHGIYKGKVGYLLWEVPAHTRPEFRGLYGVGKQEIPVKLYKTPMTEFLRITLK